ncbi:glutamate synthase small subunit [Photobacterium phosphoreum]|uniref:Glutamate synthase small subunit n=1 Tax=Photobacterium phosphoreum TaxID=659 RepID=A0A2T3K423_PHOPO|nr:glutamate synthase subunit beta [Photobacterium phosphoreum]KJF88107.1 glutamate synthase [Photobacterium phosphoreum]MCD9463906.1 glutamate synthase subunit beta [Photobacterium phosphoreum]MCD9484064.1 glutamate synthase small subunit [Photobacterium phosphoreum]MCD9490060.1 glutamate synthase small subunit [Photobacterium phosphoreum]MCF2189326.1 glutamate synthase small subunit [Photobacterium phosphoreum]
MGKPTGFLEFGRELPSKLDPSVRIQDNKEFVLNEEFGDKIQEQSSRCMDCGVPFCHNACPIGNIIPEFNDAVYRDSWEEAWNILSSTNNFPEFTGRVCPAPCESGCVLGINQDPITICNIEKTIVETAYREGYAKPKIPRSRTGKTIAVIGSGPAGLSAAEQLNSAGHTVTVFERDEKVGGLLRFGIPDFKLGMDIIDRKIDLMAQAGVKFEVNAHVGVEINAQQLRQEFDVILLTGGSTVPRNLPISGRELNGVHFAMEFLAQNNRRANDMDLKTVEVHAQDKHVVVIGGGDTGSDCVGTSNRHGAASITQVEIMPLPPEQRPANQPWPSYPMIMKTSSSHEEGCDRYWNILTKEFIDDGNGNVKGLRIADIAWQDAKPGERPNFEEIAGTERVIACDMAFLAMGFLHPEPTGVLAQLDIKLDDRGNVATQDFATSQAGVFAAGDMRTGQSLVVRCINEGRESARAIDNYLMGNSNLEAKADSLMLS